VSFTPAVVQLDPSPWITPFHRLSVGTEIAVSAAAAPTSAANPAAQKAWYFPLVLPRVIVLQRFFWLNGTTVGTDNVQIGIYNADFSAFLRGTSTLSAGANVCQMDTETATAIPAGRYWLAFWTSGTTATFFRSSTASTSRRYALAETGLASGLGTTMVGGAPGSTGFVPVFGFTSTSTP
jgi:hypothetical protein